MEMLLLTLVQVLTQGKLHQWVYWASASKSIMELFASNSSHIFIPVLNQNIINMKNKADAGDQNKENQRNEGQSKDCKIHIQF